MFFESFVLNLGVLVVLILALLYDYVTKYFSYWYVRHIPYKTPVALFGSDYHRVLALRTSAEEVNNLYHQYPNDKFVGTIRSRIPDLIIKDAENIKQVLNTDFAHFHSRGLCLNTSQDICLKNNLFYAEGEKWTLLRGRLESLLKSLTCEFEIKKDCLSKVNGESNVQNLMCEILDTVFMELLIGDANPESFHFNDLRSKLQSINVIEKLKSYCKNVFPSLYVLFGLTTLNGQPSKKTINVLQNSKLIKEVERIKLLTQEYEINEKGMKHKAESDLSIAFSTLLLFVTEGYIPCHNSLTALVFELARHPKVQEKARTAIESNDQIYLNRIINETLRLHSTHPVINRKCVKSYKFPCSDILIEKNMTLSIPLEAIHKDNKIFNEAQIFNPDRFSNEDTKSFMPFGEGPRKCVGENLTYDIMRNVTKTLLQSFVIEPLKKTPTKLRAVDHNFGKVFKDDIWLKFTPLK